MDISKCCGERDGIICPIRKSCHRFNSQAGEEQYYIEPPFVVEGNTVRCLMYWGDEQQILHDYLKSIVNGGK